MKRFSIMLLAVGTLAVFGTQAMAADGYGRSVARANHGAHHDDLQHRGYHRELVHRDAHRYPMSWRGHERLHDNQKYSVLISCTTAFNTKPITTGLNIGAHIALVRIRRTEVFVRPVASATMVATCHFGLGDKAT